MDAHGSQHADQFTPDHRNGRQEEAFPLLIGFGPDVMAMIKIVEQPGNWKAL